jgi:hypothetical protein
MANVVPLKRSGGISAEMAAGDTLPGSLAGSAVTALTIASGVVNVDCSLGDYFTLMLSANVTSVTFSNVPAAGIGRTLCIDVTEDATGGWTLALPASFKAIGNSDTAIQTAANAKTRIIPSTTDGGTTWPYAMGKVVA